MRSPRTEWLLREASQLSKISVARIVGPERGADIVWVRDAAIWVVREHFGLSLPQIGKLFHRDHTTILEACRRAERRRKADSATGSAFRRLCSQLEHVRETEEFLYDAKCYEDMRLRA